MIANTFPVRTSGWWYRSASTRPSSPGPAYRAKIQLASCPSVSEKACAELSGMARTARKTMIAGKAAAIESRYPRRQRGAAASALESPPTGTVCRVIPHRHKAVEHRVLSADAANAMSCHPLRCPVP